MEPHLAQLSKPGESLARSTHLCFRYLQLYEEFE